MVDKDKPIPDIANKNTNTEKYIIKIEPSIGTLNNKIEPIIIKVTSNKAINIAGIVLPIIISKEVRGETIVCSNVPNSFSCAIANAVIEKAIFIAKTPTKQTQIKETTYNYLKLEPYFINKKRFFIILVCRNFSKHAISR